MNKLYKENKKMNGIYKRLQQAMLSCCYCYFFHLNAKNTTFHLDLVNFVLNIKSSCLQKILHYIKMCVK